MNNIHFPNFNIPDMSDIRIPIAYSYSDTQFDIIKKHILNFQSGLDDQHEVGVLLTNFGQSMLMNVIHIGYEESVLMVFKGYVDGRYATLIQHINQINFLLTSIPIESERPARRIGFDTSNAK